MRYVFNFPDIGEGLEEGRIIEWYVKKGQAVKMGDALVKMETDKVVTDIPSPKTGVIVTLFGNAGEIVNVGGPLTELEIEGEGEAPAPKKEEVNTESVDEGGFAGVVGTIEVASGNSFMPVSDEGFEAEVVAEKPKGKVLATPVARAMAKDLGIDINTVKGTGPAQRVTKKDIQAFASKPATSVRTTQVVTSDVPDVEITPITQIRKAIARNMAKSKNTAAHMTIFDEVEITTLVDIRKKYKAKFADDGVKLTYLPFIIKALVQSLKKHPMMNSELDLENSQIIKKNFFNIGIAMDTDEGLVVPVIKNVDQKSIKAIALELEDMSNRARERKLSIDEMQGGTFTLTNYGSFGGWFGVPVINHPQVGILGVGRITKRPIVVDDEIVIGQMLPLSLSVDHRIVDGGETTRFIRDFIGYINDPISLIME